jgi:hypothetical protein
VTRWARGNSRPYRERHLLTPSSSQFDPSRKSVLTCPILPVSPATPHRPGCFPSLDMVKVCPSCESAPESEMRDGNEFSLHRKRPGAEADRLVANGPKSDMLRQFRQLPKSQRSQYSMMQGGMRWNHLEIDTIRDDE